MEGEAFPEGHVGLKGQGPVRMSRRSPTRIGHVVPAGVGLAKDLMVLALDGTLCRADRQTQSTRYVVDTAAASQAKLTACVSDVNRGLDVSSR